MTDLNQEPSVASIFVAEVAAKLSDSSSSSSSLPSGRVSDASSKKSETSGRGCAASSSLPSYSSIVRGASNDELLCRGACEVSSSSSAPELKTSDIQILPDTSEKMVLSIPACPLDASLTRPLAEDAKIAIVADTQEAVERPKLPFSETGKLVGDRHYGDYVVNARKPLKPEVINDEPAPIAAVPASSGCVLL